MTPSPEPAPPPEPALMPAAPAPAGLSAPAAVMLGFLAIAIETEIVEAILLPA